MTATQPALAGARVHVLRGGYWGASVAELVRDRGGRAEITELLRITAADPAPLRAAAEAWNRGAYDLLVMTSANAVAPFADAGGAPRAGGRVAAVGPATAQALRARGFDVDVMPAERYSASGLAAALAADAGGTPPGAVLLPISAIADDTLQLALTAAGHHVHRVTAYRTESVTPQSHPLAGAAAPLREVLLVTSASAARAVADHLAPVPDPVIVAAIGDPTAAELHRVGVRVDLIAPVHTVPGLLDAIAQHLDRSTQTSSEGPHR